MPKMRILSGMRPSGKLHIGHLLGALSNWKHLQDEGNETYYMVADWHALTTEYENSEVIHPNIIEMVLDWLAAGLDPDKSVRRDAAKTLNFLQNVRIKILKQKSKKVDDGLSKKERLVLKTAMAHAGL